MKKRLSLFGLLCVLLIIALLVFNRDSEDGVLRDLKNTDGRWNEVSEGIAIDLSGVYQSKFALRRLKRVSNICTLDLSSSQYGVNDVDNIGFHPSMWFFAARRNKKFSTLGDLSQNAPNILAVELGGSTIGDDGVAGFKEFASLERANLGGTAITDRAAETLGTLPSLRLLDVSNTTISDEFVKTLADHGSPKLESLNLASTRITSQSLSKLSTFKELKYLNLANTRISGGDLAAIASLNLKRLDLSLCDISDSDLDALIVMDSLITLGLEGSKVSKAGVEQLIEMENLSEIYVFGSSFYPDKQVKLKPND